MYQYFLESVTDVGIYEFRSENMMILCFPVTSFKDKNGFSTQYLVFFLVMILIQSSHGVLVYFYMVVLVI